jgi:uracil phosphoribosyltransferase
VSPVNPTVLDRVILVDHPSIAHDVGHVLPGLGDAGDRLFGTR